MQRRCKVGSLVLAALLLLTAGAAGATEREGAVLGEILDLEADGALVFRENLHHDERFIAQSRPGVVRLDNGWLLRFEPGAAARFRESPGDVVDVHVLTGLVWVRGPDGRDHRAGGGSRLQLEPTPVRHDGPLSPPVLRETDEAD